MKNEPQIGILHGKEADFSTALMNHINSKHAKDATAEELKIGDIPLNYECKYRLIVDRISYKVPYYASFLKSAILDGVYVINDPFWFDTADHFFNFGLISRLGVPVPKTVCLPSRAYGEDVTNQDLGNMVFPLNWDKVIDYVGLPALMKPYDDLGWQHEVIVKSSEELVHHYNQSGSAIMMIQEVLDYDMFVRCYVIGKKQVLSIPFDPAKHEFSHSGDTISKELELRLKSKSVKICKVLGYDMNTVDFAITKDGVAHAIDFMNPVPAVDPNRIGEENFEWVVQQTAKFAVDCVKKDLSSYDHHHWYQEAKLKKRARRVKKA